MCSPPMEGVSFLRNTNFLWVYTETKTKAAILGGFPPCSWSKYHVFVHLQPPCENEAIGISGAQEGSPIGSTRSEEISWLWVTSDDQIHVGEVKRTLGRMAVGNLKNSWWPLNWDSAMETRTNLRSNSSCLKF